MGFNLETLKKMLECGCDQDRKIEKEAYLHIIKSWVKHVRETMTNETPSPVKDVSLGYCFYTIVHFSVL